MSSLGMLLAQTFWLATPAILAGVLHMVVVKRKLLEQLAVPIDGGRTLGGKRIFGDNKTWRGGVVMVALGAWLGALQGHFFGDIASARGWSVLGDVALARGYATQYALAHAVFGIGYVLGELPNSFLKRRIDIGPGKKGRGVIGACFFVLDQADSVVAAFALGALFFPFGARFVILASVVLSAVHLVINLILAVTRVKREV